jgi:predicted nucleic acid-binding protein
MIALDVNVLLYAMRSDLPQHQAVSDWLESVRTNRQPVALFPPVLVGFIRIATNPRVFVNPSPLGAVTKFCACAASNARVRGAPNDRAGTGVHTGPVRTD